MSPVAISRFECVIEAVRAAASLAIPVAVIAVVVMVGIALLAIVNEPRPVLTDVLKAIDLPPSRR